MDETEDHTAPVIMQKPMIVAQAPAEFRHLLDEPISGLIAVMDVNFYIANSLASHLGKRIEQFRPIFLLRVEETVSGRISRRIVRSSVCNSRPCLLPPCHTAECGLYRCLLAEWLVMIGNSNP